MIVKNILEKLRLSIRFSLLIIQAIAGGFIFLVLVIPPLIYESIMRPKKMVCKKCNSNLIEQGYPDELGFQRMYCPRCKK